MENAAPEIYTNKYEKEYLIELVGVGEPATQLTLVVLLKVSARNNGEDLHCRVKITLPLVFFDCSRIYEDRERESNAIEIAILYAKCCLEEGLLRETVQEWLPNEEIDGRNIDDVRLRLQRRLLRVQEKRIGFR